MRASVVVPTYRRDELLRCCLERLVRQDFDPRQYEVIVADDGVSESTRVLVESLSRSTRPPLRYVPVERTRGPAAARNAGWRSSQGEVVAFTDDDCLPDAGWLAAGVAASARSDAATGRTIVPLRDPPTDFERDVAGLARAEFITANCFCRRAALEAVGGFDERFTAAWREDSDLHFSLLEHGFQIAHCPEAVVLHPVPQASWGISVKRQWRGVFDPLLYRKHPELYRQRIRPLPRFYYAAVGGVILSGLGAAGGWLWMTAGGLGLWALLTARFAWQRLRGASRSWTHVAEMIVTSAVIPLLSVYWRLRGAWRYRAFYF